MWHMVLSYIFCSFFRIFRAILSHLWVFHDFTRFIFYFLLKLALMSLWKVFMQVLRFLDFLYEQWSQIEVEIEKVSTILDSLKFGTADSPRVRGGQSAVHETCPPEALQRSSQPQKYIADSPPKDRGRSGNGQKGGSWLIISYKEKWQILDWSWVT